MNIHKTTSKTDNNARRPDKGRRSFIWKAGAGMAAALTAAVPGIAGAMSGNDTNLKFREDELARRIGMLEDENNIRLLHQTYENFLDTYLYEEAVDLFTDDGEVVFNGGLFKGKTRGISRLFCNRFRSGMTGKRIDHLPGILPDIGHHQDMVEVTPDRKTARARFSYSIQVGTPVIPHSSLDEMACQMGEGIIKWWEGGTCYFSCVKDIKNGNWKIKKLEYVVQAKTNYRPGRLYARPFSVPLFSKTYPEDPAGPDRLISVHQNTGVFG
jgi:hypothetical protein